MSKRRSRPAARELLVCGCKPDDVKLIQKLTGAAGLRVHTVGSPMQMARAAVTTRPAAVICGIDESNIEKLEVFEVIRQVCQDVPIVVVADDESIELERHARQLGVFYYAVHPLEPDEVQAMIMDLMRRACHLRSAPEREQ